MTFKITKYIIITAIILSFTGCGGGNTVSKDNQQNNESPDTPFQTNNGDKKDKPHISLNGEKTILLHPGNKFSDPGATAQDNRGKDISSAITKEGNVDIKVPGTYEIIYSVKDSNGNIDTAKRKVIVLGIIQNPESKKPSGIVLNELLALNNNSAIDPDFKQFSDYIELYNHSGNNINIGHYYLSDDPQNLKKWQFPNNLSLNNGEHLLVWADKKDKKAKALHTNFSLSGDGETVILSDASGNIVDQITFKKQKRDISVTKIDDTNYFMNPTPAKQNTQATNALVKSKKPTFSLESGFYDGSVNVELTQQNKGKIYYTTDGSIPTTNSPVYSQPIPVSETTVIRARALENNKFLSSTVNHTFLINENISLPVVSIAIDNKYLYDDQIGIYVIGTDDEGNPNPPKDRTKTNFYQPWLRPAGIELIKNGKSQFSENVGLKIHGDGSRPRPQKSFDIYAKSKYGSKSIKYPLFRYKPNITKVKSFILRKSTPQNPFRDGLCQSIIKENFKVGYQSFEPTVIFLNGQYWGILNIREKENEDYFAANYHVDPDNLDILVTTNEQNTYEIKSGTDKDYRTLIQFMDTHDSNDPLFANYITSSIDFNSYLDFFIIKNFFNDRDWMARNVKFWKEQKTESRWKYVVYDFDSALGSPAQNTFEFSLAAEDAATHYPYWMRLFHIRIMNNDLLRQKFISRYTTHLNISFRSDKMLHIADQIIQEVSPEISRHFKKWPTARSYADDMNTRYNFLKVRTNYVRQHLATWFGLTGNNNLHIETSGNGKVYIDDIKIPVTFDGTYFDNTIVTLKAVADQNHSFSGWNDGVASETRELKLDNNVSLKAIFQ